MRRAISAALAAAALAAAAPYAAADRAELRATGGDRVTAERVGRVLLARPLALQLLHVRCERYREQRFCGLTLSGVKFHRRVDLAVFRDEVDGLVRRTLAADPSIAEVDVTVTVPLNAGKGAIVSGDFALPSAATVFATTVPRGAAGSPSAGPEVFWDPAFRRELTTGANG